MAIFRADILGLVLALTVGALVGVGTFTFYYGEGHSYFSDDPRVCVNCHIMQPQYDEWIHSSHARVAGCNDCHMPQESAIEAFIAKADNGFRHSWAFTFQDFHEPIQMTPRNQEILQNNCLRCHQDIVHQMVTVAPSPQAVSCVHCHADVGHGGRFGHVRR